jgi:hypothetical protein
MFVYIELCNQVATQLDLRFKKYGSPPTGLKRRTPDGCIEEGIKEVQQ